MAVRPCGSEVFRGSYNRPALRILRRKSVNESRKTITFQYYRSGSYILASRRTSEVDPASLFDGRPKSSACLRKASIQICRPSGCSANGYAFSRAARNSAVFLVSAITRSTIRSATCVSVMSSGMVQIKDYLHHRMSTMDDPIYPYRTRGTVRYLSRRSIGDSFARANSTQGSVNPQFS